MKTKAGKHKICGIYLQIRNLPPNIRSKLDNIFLVALVSSEDLKNDYVLDKVNEILFKELSDLETNGFVTSDNKTWKAALINIASDNLGANFFFGFSKGFAARYYCRICRMPNNVCETCTREDLNQLRTAETHSMDLTLLEEEPSTSLIESTGVRMKFSLNYLHNYDIFENPSVDIMHDLHEGLVHFFCSSFFNVCVEKNLGNEQKLIQKIRDFEYGHLFSSKLPSKLKICNSNLGQNASQSHCVIMHLPFIFYDWRHQLADIWPILLALLSCFQTVMSHRITERNIQRLEENVERFLFGMKLMKNLTPKAHFLTHYASIIRKVGPLRHMWMMRFESKHKVFTDAAHRTSNFINIRKTLAMQHQETLCLKDLAIKDNIVESKHLSKPTEIELKQYESLLGCPENIDFDDFTYLKFLEFNNYSYRHGYVLIEKFLPYKIFWILKSQNDYYFFCHMYTIVKFEESLNSIEIEQQSSGNSIFLKLSELTNKQPFEPIEFKGKSYVIAENLTVYNFSGEEI